MQQASPICLIIGDASIEASSSIILHVSYISYSRRRGSVIRVSYMVRSKVLCVWNPVSYNFVGTRRYLTLCISYSLSSRTDHFLLHQLSTSAATTCPPLSPTSTPPLAGRPIAYTSAALAGVLCRSCMLPAAHRHTLHAQHAPRTCMHTLLLTGRGCRADQARPGPLQDKPYAPAVVPGPHHCFKKQHCACTTVGIPIRQSSSTIAGSSRVPMKFNFLQQLSIMLDKASLLCVCT